MSVIIDLNESFKSEVVDFDGLTLVDFWAPWCRYCVLLVPTLEALAAKFDEDEFQIVKINVDDHPTIGQEQGVMALPTLRFYKAGNELDIEVNDRSIEALEKIVRDNI